MSDKKSVILQCGKALFGTKGFKDTNISDITQMAGVAVGTFYNYYTSKEKLFLEIFLQENTFLKKEIMKTVNLDGEPLAVMKEVMALNMMGMSTHPILKQWYNRDVYDKIERLYREENGLGHDDFMYGIFMDLVKRWQLEGKMRADIDSGVIMAMFAALIHIDTHKEEVGLQYFPQVLNYMAEFVMRGLTV